MNDRMRRYLDEDWDQEQEQAMRASEPRDKRPAKPIAQDRRQKQKEWGKAHAAWWKSVKKNGGYSGKL